MMSARLAYEPEIVLPPGESMLEMMSARGWSEHDVAERSGMPPARVLEIAAGALLTGGEADGLGRAFGCPARIWSARSAAYEEWLLRPRPKRHAGPPEPWRRYMRYGQSNTNRRGRPSRGGDDD